MDAMDLMDDMDAADTVDPVPPLHLPTYWCALLHCLDLSRACAFGKQGVFGLQEPGMSLNSAHLPGLVNRSL